jgi:hypothetical protein
MSARRSGVGVLLMLVVLALTTPARAAQEGTLTIGLHVTLVQIQRIVAERTLVAPIFQQAFLWGVGPRVVESGAGLIPGFSYAAPFEDLKVK